MTLDPAYSLLSEDPTVIRAAGASPDDYPSVVLDGPLGPCVVVFVNESMAQVRAGDNANVDANPTRQGWTANRVRYHVGAFLVRDGLSWKVGPHDHQSIRRSNWTKWADSGPSSSARERILDCAVGAVRFADKLRPMLSLRAAVNSTERALADATEKMREADEALLRTQATAEAARDAHTRATQALAAAEVDANREAAGLAPRTV